MNIKKLIGFTLIELLIVVAMIGILAGSIMLNSGTAVDSSEAATIYSNLKTLKNAGITYFAENARNKSDSDPMVQWRTIADENDGMPGNDQDDNDKPKSVLLKYIDSAQIAGDIIYAYGEDPLKNEKDAYFIGLKFNWNKRKVMEILARNDGVLFAEGDPVDDKGYEKDSLTGYVAKETGDWKVFLRVK